MQIQIWCQWSLSLVPLSKRYRGQLLPTWGLWTFENFFVKDCSPGHSWLCTAKTASGGASVGWGVVSGSHQSGVSGVQQANAESDLALWEDG